METWTLALEFLLGLILILSLMFLVWVYFATITHCGAWVVPKGDIAPDCISSISPTGKASVCTFAEKQRDESMHNPPPKSKMVLTSFSKSDVAGARPYCRPMWYAYKFVDKNGNYSAMSEWSDVIYAGAPKLPCAGGEGNCTHLKIYPGKKSIDASQLTIGVVETLPYSLMNSNEIVANVHRQIGDIGQTSPNASDDGEIIGNLLEGDQYPPLKYFYVDVVCNSPQNPGECLTK